MWSQGSVVSSHTFTASLSWVAALKGISFEWMNESNCTGSLKNNIRIKMSTKVMKLFVSITLSRDFQHFVKLTKL